MSAMDKSTREAQPTKSVADTTFMMNTDEAAA